MSQLSQREHMQNAGNDCSSTASLPACSTWAYPVIPRTISNEPWSWIPIFCWPTPRWVCCMCCPRECFRPRRCVGTGPFAAYALLY